VKFGIHENGANFQNAVLLTCILKINR